VTFQISLDLFITFLLFADYYYYFHSYYYY